MRKRVWDMRVVSSSSCTEITSGSQCSPHKSLPGHYFLSLEGDMGEDIHKGSIPRHMQTSKLQITIVGQYCLCSFYLSTYHKIQIFLTLFFISISCFWHIALPLVFPHCPSCHFTLCHPSQRSIFKAFGCWLYIFCCCCFYYFLRITTQRVEEYKVRLCYGSLEVN